MAAVSGCVCDVWAVFCVDAFSTKPSDTEAKSQRYLRPPLCHNQSYETDPQMCVFFLKYRRSEWKELRLGFSLFFQHFVYFCAGCNTVLNPSLCFCASPAPLSCVFMVKHHFKRLFYQTKRSNPKHLCLSGGASSTQTCVRHNGGMKKAKCDVIGTCGRQKELNFQYSSWIQPISARLFVCTAFGAWILSE